MNEEREEPTSETSALESDASETDARETGAQGTGVPEADWAPATDWVGKGSASDATVEELLAALVTEDEAIDGAMYEGGGE